MSTTKAVSFFLVFLSVAAWHLQQTPKQHRDAELIVAEYVFFLAATLFGSVLVDRFGNDLARVASGFKSWTFAACGLLLLMGLGLLGMRQFGGFDQSTVILSGWIVRSGLVPFRDVPCTLPPLFVMGSAAALSVFGVHWWAFVALATTFAAVTFVWLLDQLSIVGLPRPLAAVLALVAPLATVMVGGYWWYNPISSLAVCLTFVSSLACLRESRSWWPWASLAGSFCLLLLAKPNAWPMTAGVAVLLLAGTSRARMKAAVAAAAGMTAAVVLCLAHGFGPGDVLRAYRGVAATRGTPFSLIAFSDYLPVERTYLLLIVAWLAALFLGLLAEARHEWRRFWREYACAVAAGLTSVWMTFTNYELKPSDLTPLVLATVMIAFRPWDRRAFTVPARRAVAAVLIGLVVASGYWSATRLRIRAIGEGMFFQYPGDISTSGGFFAGLRSGPRLVAVVEQAQQALRDHPGKVFFGPRMEFLYAALDRQPPRSLPLFWHPGSAYPSSDTPAIVDAFVANRFDTLVFLRGDFTRMPVELLFEVGRSYEQVGPYPELTVFRLRPGSTGSN